jgi:hypothetical protein
MKNIYGIYTIDIKRKMILHEQNVCPMDYKLSMYCTFFKNHIFMHTILHS